MELFRFSIKTLLRRKLLVTAYIVLFVVFHVINLQKLPLLEEMWYGAYLFRTQDFGLYSFAFFLFFSFEYFGYAEQASLSETLSAYYPNGLFSQLWQFGMLMLLILVLTGINLIYQTAAYFLAGMDYLPLLVHVLEAALLNTLMPMILAALIGAVVSFCPNRTTAYGILVGTSFVISPLADDIFIMLNWFFSAYKIRDVISVIAQPLEWLPDSLYGLTLEDYRWNLALFWCGLLGCILVYKLGDQRSKISLVLCVVLLASSGFQLCGFVQQMNRDSVVHLDTRTDGTLFGDANYWAVHESKSEEASFEVLSYGMTLKVDRCLEADVKVSVTPSADTDKYKFTLWYGYEVDAVTDASGVPLSFTRDGVYLEVIYDCPGDSGVICFQYSGNGNKYYTNSQAIALPGYIPYYPMAGYLDLWDGYETVVHTDFTVKEFRITVHTDLPLITNLEQTGDHTYSGTAETVSIFGGFLEVVEEDGYTYMQLLMEPQEVDFAAVDAEVPQDLTEMVIMYCPSYLRLASGANNEDYVVFNDHIIVSSYSTSILTRVLAGAYESE